MIYSPEFETMSRDNLEQLQLERLQLTLHRVYKNVAAYHHKLEEQSIDVEAIGSLEDLKILPFTTKEDLEQSYPYDAFAVPLRDIVRIHTTSATTADPIVVGYTRNDLNHWSVMVARVLAAAGITDHDFVQIARHYNLGTSGLGFHYGAEEIGASVIPSSHENVRRQIKIMRDYKSTVLVSTPGYALHVANQLAEANIHPDELNLRLGLFGSEAWSEALRTQIEETLHISAYDNYGLSEVVGPGVAFECEERDGLHVNEDHCIVELIDPNSGLSVAPGETGELVFTTITKEGFPIIRFRSGDISSLVPGECSCGRTTSRIARIRHRVDDMIIVEGVNVFPSQIEAVLREAEGVEPHFLINLDRVEGLDTMEIQVEVSAALPGLDEAGRLLEFQHRVEESIETSIGFRPKVSLVESSTIERASNDVPRRVVDRRTD